MSVANDFIACCLFHGSSNSKLNAQIERLNPLMFDTDFSRSAFRAIRNLHNKNAVIDIISVSDESNCDLASLGQIVADVINKDRFVDYANLITDSYHTRETKARLTELASSLDENRPAASHELREQVERVLNQFNDNTLEKQKTAFSLGSDGFDNSIDWLVKNVIPSASFGYIYGMSGSYKSFFLIDIMCAISAGINWSGKLTKQGAVVYIAAEGGLGVRRRLKAWELHNNHKLTNFALISEPIIINESDGIEKVLAIIDDVEKHTGQKVTAVCVDTLARCYSGNENDNSEMNKFIQACDTIKTSRDCSVIAVHHSGKDAERGARGASSLRAAADFEYRITRPKDTKLKFQLDCTKQKDADEQERLELSLQSVHLGTVDQDGDDLFSLAVGGISNNPLTDAFQDLLDQQQKQGGKKQDNIIGQVRLILESNCKDGDIFNYSFMRDEYYSQNKDKDKSKLRLPFSRALSKLESDGVISKVGHDGKYILNGEKQNKQFNKEGF